MTRIGDEEMMTRKEAAEYLGVSPSTLWKEANARRVRFTMMPRGMRFTRRALDEWLKSREVAVCRR